jgi:hypothetical protein
MLTVCALLLAGCGLIIQSLPPPPQFNPSQAQPVLFGLTVNNFANVKPLVSFGTTRSWDAYPGLDWADANPAAGQYNFAPLDSFIAINQARGAEIIYTFGRTPQWASTQPNAPGPYGPGQCAPPTLAAWDQYVTAVVTNAAGRIRYWELWNEPDGAQFFCGGIPTMVTLAQHAYAIIHRIDPAAQLLSPGVEGSAGPAWLDSFLSAGGANAVDIIAFHGYGSTHAEDLNSIVAGYRTVMRAHAISAMPLWDTEGGWGDTGMGDSSHRAAFVAKFYVLQWSQGVARAVWYSYDNNDTWGRLINAQSALNPAGLAYRETYSWLVGATLTAPCTADGNATWTCPLTRPGAYTAEMVWNSTRNLTYPAPAEMTQVRDLAGNTAPISNGTVPIGNNPILIETAISVP